MALLAAGQLTLADAAKRLAPNGSQLKIAEVLSQDNEILEDAVFLPANGQTKHTVGIRTGLPTVYYRMINQGVPSSKSTSVQVDEPMAMLEARSQVDERLVRLNGNSADFRLKEDMTFLEAMAQAQAADMFYGNPGTDPRQYLGLQTRYSSLSAGNGTNIIDAGGTSTDNASMYLVVWGEGGVYCTYPNGSEAGISQKDLGLDDVQDANGNYYQAYKSLFQWDHGLVVEDWQKVVRIANIDVSDLTAGTGTQAITASTYLPDLMSRAIDHTKVNKGRPVYYANRNAMSLLRVAARRGTVQTLTIEKGLNQFGQSVTTMSFMGIPIRMVDRLLSTESRVV